MISYKQFIHQYLPWFILAVSMNILRLLLTDVSSYIWLNWNLFLAFIPLFALFFFEKIAEKKYRIIPALLWLLFLPNAPYIITDFIHLRNVGPEWMLWFDGMMIFLYAFLGMMSFSYSSLKMMQYVKKPQLFIALVALLSSFGIYLGRYIRWNSWDIITRPFHLFADIFRVLQEHHLEPEFLLTIVFFSLIMLVSVLSGKKMFQVE